MELLTAGQEFPQLPEPVIFLERCRPGIVNLVVEPRRRIEFQASDAALVIIVDDWIEGEAPAVVGAEAETDDGANLATIDLGFPPFLVPAEFEIHSVIEIVVGIVGLDEQRPQFEAIIGQAPVFAVGIERQVYSCG